MFVFGYRLSSEDGLKVCVVVWVGLNIVCVVVMVYLLLDVFFSC